MFVLHNVYLIVYFLHRDHKRGKGKITAPYQSKEKLQLLSKGSLFSLDAVMLLHCLEASHDRTWWNPSTEEIFHLKEDFIEGQE